MFLRKVLFKPGLNPPLFTAVQKKTKALSGNDIVLMWDEISLKKWFTYIRRFDRVVGFADYGDGQRPNKAGHALIFMIKFVYFDVKFPICYFFTTGSEKAEELAPLVVRDVTQLQNIDLMIRGMVCDAPAKQRALFRLLGATPEEPFVFINGIKIYVFLDPSHGIKAIRNCLMTHIFQDGQRQILYEHVKTFFTCQGQGVPSTP